MAKKGIIVSGSAIPPWFPFVMMMWMFWMMYLFEFGPFAK